MYFDIAMPLTLFFVTLVSLFLNKKVESKLKSTLEERELSVRDAVLLVASMTVMVLLIVFLREQISAMMILFLFSYSMLLFIFTYIFSKERWYVAAAPPAIFVILYLFFNETPMWTNYLVNIYGVVFAVLITLYIGSLFPWKTALVFAILLTIMDIILVLVTGLMVSAATKTMELNLPVVIAVPIIPFIITQSGIYAKMYLGLGDFFFAGLLAIQTFRKFGKKFAIVSAVTMSASFLVFEAFLLTYGIGAFPGTLMIICGWLPLVLFKSLKKMVAS